MASAMMSSISCGLAQPKASDMLFGHHRIVERVGLVVEFDDRARQGRAFLDPETLGDRARGDVAHHDFQRDDLDFADQLLAHVDARMKWVGMPIRFRW
jgi:hypothetical protein